MKVIAVCSFAFVLMHYLPVAGDQPLASSPEAANQLFASLAGSWSCAGSFSDGRALAANITFTLHADGRSLLYHHQDRAPNSFIQDALWGPDNTNHAVVSLAFAGNSQLLGPQLFVAYSWSPSSIVFEAKPLTSPPFAPNRFTYSLEGMKTLHIVWEVQRQGVWSVGDQLNCTREHQRSPNRMGMLIH